MGMFLFVCFVLFPSPLLQSQYVEKREKLSNERKVYQGEHGQWTHDSVFLSGFEKFGIQGSGKNELKRYFRGIGGVSMIWKEQREQDHLSSV